MRTGLLLLVLVLTLCAGCQSSGVPDPLRDQTYSQRGELRLLADVHQPATRSPAPAVVIVHGGSWARGSRSRMEGVAKAVAEHGFVAVNIEYRLAPEDPYPAAIEDVLAAVCWVRRNAKRLGVDPSRVALWGYSAGAHLSALAGSRPRTLNAADAGGDPSVQACVLGATPTDLRRFGNARPVRRFLGGPPDELPLLTASASPVNAVHAQSPPTFLYHGRDDWIVGLEHAEALRDALEARGVPVELAVTERGHLTQLLCHANVLERALAFLDRWLQPDSKRLLAR